MSPTDFVEKNDKEKRLSHIKNLFLIAAADGKVHPNEIDLISQVSVRIGLSGEELKYVMNNPQDIPFAPPSAFNDKILQLHDMFRLIMIDGTVEGNEIILIHYFAGKLGFNSKDVEEIVSEMINGIKRGIEINKLILELGEKYS
jgi:hypothetical protein